MNKKQIVSLGISMCIFFNTSVFAKGIQEKEEKNNKISYSTKYQSEEYKKYQEAIKKLELDENLTENQKLVIKNLFTEKYNEKTKGNRINLEASKRWDPTTIGLPPLKVTSGYTYLGTVYNDIQVQIDANDQTARLLAVSAGVAAFAKCTLPAKLIGGGIAVVEGHNYYLNTLPKNVIAYSEQYFRWTNVDRYEYEYKYISGFKDKNSGKILSRKTSYSIGDFGYLVN